jgi:hypothetical protein
VALVAVIAIAVGLVVAGIKFDVFSAPKAPESGSDLDFLSFGHDIFDFSPGSSKTIGGKTVRFTDSADLQVVDGDGTVLWHTNTAASCTGRCRAVLQSDGNLVVSGPSGVLWSSGTDRSPGATLVFQARQSYLTIRDAAYNVVWTSNGDLRTGAAGMLATEINAPGAVPVQSFLDSLAVNTHMDQYERDAAQVYGKLDYLGVRTIRDHYSEDGSLLANYTYLAQRGIRFDMLHYSSDFAVLVRDAGVMAGLPNRALVAVEGPNEINNFPFTCDGSTWRGGWNNNNGAAAQCFMQNYYGRVKSDPRLADVLVYNLTGSTSVVDPDRYGLLTLDGHADLGNIHVYPAPGEQPRNTLLRALGGEYLNVPPTEAVITESGYQTSDVGDQAQARYYLNLYLDAFKAGFRTTYVYELTDNADETFGFFDTANKPKPSATAMHNLTTLLADPGPQRGGSLDYSLTGMPAEAHSLALQRSSGAVNLILWDERPIWNNGPTTPTAAPVKVQLGQTFSKVSVFAPLSGSTPVQELTEISSLDLQLAGEPLVLELVP